MGSPRFFANGVPREPIADSRFLHGYGVSFKLWFEGELDERNWVMDFGSAKRSKCMIDEMCLKDWMEYMFDHTFIVAEDDPFIDSFLKMDEHGVAQVRVIPSVGCEKFAEYIYSKLNPWVKEETDGRVRITKVEFREHNKNSAIYEESSPNSKLEAVLKTLSTLG